MVGLVVLAGLMGLAAVGILVWSWWAPRIAGRARLAGLRTPPGPGRKAPGSQPLSVQAPRDHAATLSQLLRGYSWYEALQVELLRAGWLLRPSEFVALSALLALFGAAVLMLLTRSLPMGILIAAVGAALPYMLMKSKQAQRNKNLSAQLPDALDMLCSALRAGFSISRGLELVRSQMHPPISEEFGRVLEETQFGISLPEALDGIIVRSANYDVELVVAAIQTQLELGGNLAEVLTNISGMIRERVKLSGEIAAATAEGRFSAGILLAMPIAIAFAINIINPGYIEPLFTTTLGMIMLGVGGVLMVTGALIIRKLIAVEL